MSALLKVYDHIKAVNSKSPCIINMSYGETGYTTQHPLYEETYRDIVLALSALPNVVMVASAGNEPSVRQAPQTLKRGGTPIIDAPQIFGKDLDNFVLVGAATDTLENQFQVDTTYKNFVWARGKKITTVKPYDPRNAPDEFLGDWYQFGREGATSVATATVSGMLANYLSRSLGSKTAIKDAISLLKKNSVIRSRGGVPIISSGVTPSQWPSEDRKAVGYSYLASKTSRQCYLRWSVADEAYDCFP
ncbi:hypothetical protein TWF694_005736 [Orbilia ellipsospora]|uniref:L27 domain-containing protein n=1 Tax=Orbilia ellipsospora TaxID=2528407 RepID=A0AAV9WXW0_9PEZI